MDITELLDLVDKCDSSYYNDSVSLISDAEYDSIKDQIKAYKAMDKDLKSRVKQTLSRVGAPVDDSPWEKVNHEVPMQSLNKVNTPEELDEWISKLNSPSRFLVTEKLDGLSVSLKYENGKLIQALTRGSGVKGEDITRNVLKMKGVVSNIVKPYSHFHNFSGHIRGEIVLRKSDFNLHFKDTMSNVRNAASGITKRLDGKDCEHLSVIVYKLEGIDHSSEADVYYTLQDMGFSVPYYIGAETSKEIVSVWNEYMESRREALDYEIDGLVVIVNDIAEQVALGDLNNRPKGSIAFKFVSLSAITTLRNIICQVGDTGVITPVAEFDEVFLVGSRVTRSSLHNFSNVKNLGIDIGAEIEVKRANDVIPFITRVTKTTGSVYSTPTQCPDCGTILIPKGEYIVCPNKSTCPRQVIGKFNKWISELNIMEWGEKVLQKMLDAGIIRDVADIYKLKVDDIATLDRMGEKSAQNLISELDKFRTISLENFLGGLAIDGVATTTVKQVISSGFDTLESIQNLSVSQLESISGFGSIKANSLYKGLIENKQRIDDILNAGVKIKSKVKGNLSNSSFCFTGAMSIPRAKLQKMVEDAGGEVKKSVVKGLSYLVSNEDSSSNKSQAAKKLNVKVITEQQFMEKLEK